MTALGLIVNPVAGLGGRVGLKGTDGPDRALLARALGATPVAPGRTARALARLTGLREKLTVVAGAREMGADLARAHGFRTVAVAAGEADETTAEDTRRAAREMESRKVDLILFAGGDGTARDVVEAVGTRVGILGIPTGVKMHSGVFAATPEAAGELAAAYLSRRGEVPLGEREVVDVDESALAAGRVSSRLYGVALVPDDRSRVPRQKAASTPPDVALDALCREIAKETRGLTFFGPGTTTQRILAHLGLEGTLLGVDAVEDGQLVGTDLSEHDLLALLDGREARLILGVVGQQGFLLGRGNQQLSPEVLRRIGLDRIEIVAGLDKLLALRPPLLRVDTGDPSLDRQLSGYRRVRVAPGRSVLIEVGT